MTTGKKARAHLVPVSAFVSNDREALLGFPFRAPYRRSSGSVPITLQSGTAAG